MTTVRPCRIAASGLAVLAALLAGCAGQPYVPAPIDPPAEQARWLGARVDDPALREALARQGVDTGVWPLPAWDLDALTVLALSRHPELAVARAEQRRADAARAVARQRGGQGVEVTAEHHSVRSEQGSPWTLGVVFDTLLTGRARRAAQADAADALADEAVQRAAQTVWQVRQRVRSVQRALYFAQQRAEAADAAAALQGAVAAAQQARLARGAIGAREALLADEAHAEAGRQAALAADAVGRARLDLAEAVGLPGTVLDTLALRFDGLADAEAPLPPALALQRAALLHRVDLRAGLARYAAADAQLRLELARQWPELVLKPGYAWDQGDNRWSLGLALNLPPGGDNGAPIAQASALREVEAQRCRALQVAALAALDAARQALAAADARQAAAKARWQASGARRARAERRLAAGDADRIELLTARLAEADARQQLIEARSARWVAEGGLEDVVQQPLDAADTAPAPAPLAWQTSAAAGAAAP